MRLPMLLAALAVAAAGAQVSGRIQFSPEQPLAGASVTLTNEETGVRRIAWSNTEGCYSISGVHPGVYKMLVRMEGFQTAARTGIRLDVDEQARIDLTMQLGRIEQSIVVESATPFLETEEAGTSTVVQRDLLDNVPLNGRGLLTLLEAAPGVVITPANANVDPGQFSVNGQRADANYVTVDGVSIGAGIGASVRHWLGGGLPVLTSIGSMHSLISTDALEEFRIATAGGRADSGHTAGGQLILSTRSGTNQLHGSAYEFLRNSSLDANDWFANRAADARPLLQFHDFGGTLGGPVRRDRTFFFAAVEALRLRQSTVIVETVPDAATRLQAPPSMRPWMMALPNGTPTSFGDAVFTEIAPDRAHVESASLRLDHAFSSRLQFFSRYQHAPSFTHQYSLAGLQRTDVATALDSWTAGLDAALTHSMQNHFRISYSRNQVESAEGNRGAAANIDFAAFSPVSFPAGGANYAASAGVALPLTTNDARNRQDQWNLTDSSDTNRGRHLLQFGADFRRLATNLWTRPYDIMTSFMNVSALLNGQGMLAMVSRREPLSVSMQQVAAFLQDTWNLTSGLTVTGGVRWELAPPPAVSAGRPIFAALTSTVWSDPLSYRSSVDAGTLWKTEPGNFAPRLGVAWKPWRTRNLAIRAAAGVHYDLGLGPALSITEPVSSVRIYVGVPNQFWTWQLASSADPSASSGPPAYAVVSSFRTPYTVEWNATVEQELPGSWLAAITYLGSAGRRLLTEERTTDMTTQVITNRGTSAYNALQANLRTRMRAGFQVSASFSWAHSIDNASHAALNEFITLVESPDASINRGNSDFDVRFASLAMFTWQPRHLHGWSLDGILRMRSGFPFDVLGLATTAYGSARPDMVAGQPLWIADANSPVGRRLNFSAFQNAATGRQGSLGRNAIFGPGMSQVDLALQKEFAISERAALRCRLEVFNLWNHPNFGNPQGSMAVGTFGTPISMLNQFLGSGSPDSGLVPALQIGGPRALQIGLRLHF